MRPDFSHHDPKLQALDPSADSNPFSSDNLNVAHCQINREPINKDLFWNPSIGHPTRQFIEDKAEFLKTAFSEQSIEDSTKSIANEVVYNDLSQIPPGMPRCDALQLPLTQSVGYYLRECVVLTPTMLFQQLSVDDRKRQKEALKLCLKFAYLVDGRFIVKHEFLRDSPLRHYHKEWMLLIQCFYLNQSRVSRAVFIDIVGPQQIGYEEAEQMLKMMAVRKSIISRDDIDGDEHKTESKSWSKSDALTRRRRFVWCLKRDNADDSLLQSAWPQVIERGTKVMEDAIDKSGLRQYEFDDLGNDDPIDKMDANQTVNDVDWSSYRYRNHNGNGSKHHTADVMMNDIPIKSENHKLNERNHNGNNHNHRMMEIDGSSSGSSPEKAQSPPIKMAQNPLIPKMKKKESTPLKAKKQKKEKKQKQKESKTKATPKTKERTKEKKKEKERDKKEVKQEMKEDVDSKEAPVENTEITVKEEEDPEVLRIRKEPQYMACFKFMEQKLRKNKVLLRSEVEVLIHKYSKKHVVLRDMPGNVIDLVRDELCWVIKGDRYCLREIQEFNGETGKKQYNEYRKKIVEYWNLSRNKKREQIKDNTARIQFKGLEMPEKGTYDIIMRSICDWNDEKKCWSLKSGQRIRKK